MSSTATKIANLIVPDIFANYVIEESINKSAFFQSGILQKDSRIKGILNSGGNIFELPFYQDLSGDDGLFDDTVDIEYDKVDAISDKAVLISRQKAWGAASFAKYLSGDDPMRAIGDMVARYWMTRMQQVLLSTLTGYFSDNSTNDSSDHINDISIEDGNNAADSNKIGSDSVIDTVGLLGDKLDSIGAIAMHSTPYLNLLKLNLIDFVKMSGQSIEIPTYLGKVVIVDDGLPRTAGSTSGYKYSNYLFGMGSIAYEEKTIMNEEAVETDRDSLGSGGTDILINRRQFIMHPRGIAFQNSSMAKSTPTNAELEMQANWDRVYESKNIKVLELITNG